MVWIVLLGLVGFFGGFFFIFVPLMDRFEDWSYNRWENNNKKWAKKKGRR